MSDKRTALYGFHISHYAKMVSFAGWDMPMNYEAGIKAEHLATRHEAGLFDVSHMAQITLAGKNAGKMLEQITPTDTSTIAEGHLRYSVFLNEMGGVLDDLIIGKLDGVFRLVVNAGRANEDIAFLKAHLLPEVDMQIITDRALIALQGPLAGQVLDALGSDVSDLYFMQLRHQRIAGFDVIINRSGYTGEDGFEISVASDDATTLAKAIFAHKHVHLAGLGARDTLRLEAGLPLYGHELDETITPIEAGLGFAIAKSRKDRRDFPGAEVILSQIKNGAPRQLVGLVPSGGRPVRDGAILEMNGVPIGHVTSGGYAPSLSQPIAAGFITSDHAKIGTKIDANMAGRKAEMMVTEMPFVPHRYYRKPK